MHMEGKARMKVINCSASNPLTWRERLLYSKLLFLPRKNKPASYKKLAKDTGLNQQRTIPRLLQGLQDYGLVQLQNGKWLAKEPPIPQ